MGTQKHRINVTVHLSTQKTRSTGEWDNNYNFTLKKFLIWTYGYTWQNEPLHVISNNVAFLQV